MAERAIFMGLLEEVEAGASPGRLKGIIFSKGVDGREWLDWLGRFGERLRETPGQHGELARRMVRLGECREEVPVVAAAIGRELLAAVREVGSPEVEVTDEREDVDVSAAGLVIRGFSEILTRNFRKAIAFFDRALAIKPDDHVAWSNRGVALAKLGELSKAIASYDKALAIKPDYHEAWDGRGVALAKLGELSKAIASFDKALAIKPDDHEVWINRGIAVGQAVSYNPIAAENLQALFPDSPPVTPNPQLTRGGYEGQLLCYEEGLKHCPADTHPEGYGELHRAIGQTHHSRGKSDYRQRRPLYWQAVSSYNRAFSTLTKEAYPELHLETLRDLIKALLGLGQTAEVQQLRRDGTDLLRRLVEDKKRSQESKQRLALKFADFQQLTVDTFVQSGQWREAWEAAEAGKNACLSWLLYALADELPDCGYAGVARLLRERRAIVYWHLSPIALTTFVLKYGEEGPVLLSSAVLTETAPDFTDEAPLERRVEYERLNQFEAWLEKWNQLYGDYREGKTEERTGATWVEELPGMLEELKKILDIEGIETALKKPKEARDRNCLKETEGGERVDISSPPRLTSVAVA